jgi:hypothetical protein
VCYQVGLCDELIARPGEAWAAEPEMMMMIMMMMRIIIIYFFIIIH